VWRHFPSSREIIGPLQHYEFFMKEISTMTNNNNASHTQNSIFSPNQIEIQLEPRKSNMKEHKKDVVVILFKIDTNHLLGYLQHKANVHHINLISASNLICDK
jgi:hypothetical protein